MTRNLKNNQSSAGTKDTIYVGYDDLTRDTDAIKDLVTRPGTAGVMMKVSHAGKKDIFIYRPTTPLPTNKDVVKTVRKFLSLVAVLQGRTSLTAVHDAQKLPENTLDMEEVLVYLKNHSLISNNQP